MNSTKKHLNQKMLQIGLNMDNFNQEIVEDLEAVVIKLQNGERKLSTNHKIHLTKKEILDMYRFTLDKSCKRYMITCEETGIGIGYTIQTVENNPVKMDIADYDSW